jgi:hypothetical protein
VAWTSEYDGVNNHSLEGSCRLILGECTGTCRLRKHGRLYSRPVSNCISCVELPITVSCLAPLHFCGKKIRDPWFHSVSFLAEWMDGWSELEAISVHSFLLMLKLPKGATIPIRRKSRAFAREIAIIGDKLHSCYILFLVRLMGSCIFIQINAIKSSVHNRKIQKTSRGAVIGTTDRPESILVISGRNHSIGIGSWVANGDGVGGVNNRHSPDDLISKVASGMASIVGDKVGTEFRAIDCPADENGDIAVARISCGGVQLGVVDAALESLFGCTNEHDSRENGVLNNHSPNDLNSRIASCIASIVSDKLGTDFQWHPVRSSRRSTQESVRLHQ